MRAIVFVLGLLLPVIAHAQQPAPDVATLQKIIGALQQQRNQAMDGIASCEIRVSSATEETEKLKVELAKLKPTNENKKEK